MNEIEKAINYIFDMMPQNEEEARHLSVALGALHEKAEREKGCPHCKSEIAVVDRKDREILNPFYYPILNKKYCHNCGRRLEVEQDG